MTYLHRNHPAPTIADAMIIMILCGSDILICVIVEAILVTYNKCIGDIQAESTFFSQREHPMFIQ